MNQRSRGYLRPSELKILRILNKYKKGLTWSELLEKTGFSKSTLSEALRHLKKMGLISKAIRDDEKTVYKAEVTRNALKTLEMIEEYINYTALRKAVEKMDQDLLYDHIKDIFLLIGAALIVELQIEASDTQDPQDLQKRLRKAKERILQASSKILDKLLKEISTNPQKLHQTLTQEDPS